MAGNNVEYSWGKPDFGHESGDAGDGEGGLFAGFENDSVAGDEGGCGFGSEEINGGVPRDDESDDAVGLAESHGDVPGGVDTGLALDGRPSFGIVVELGGGEMAVVESGYRNAHGDGLETAQLVMVLADEGGEFFQ